MGTTTINVSCLDQRLMLTSAPTIASGGRNENEVVFSFCPLWDGFEKVAVFYRNKDHVYSAFLEDDKCIIPWEVLTDAGEFFISVFGSNGEATRTSEVVRYKIVEGAITEDTEISDPTAEMYEQILAAYTEALYLVNTHVHGNLANDGTVGTKSDYILTTETGGRMVASSPNSARNKLGLHTVAVSGSYNDLADKPYIPDAVTVDDAVTTTGANPVSSAAVYNYVDERFAEIMSFEEVAF